MYRIELGFPDLEYIFRNIDLRILINLYVYENVANNQPLFTLPHSNTYFYKLG